MADYEVGNLQIKFSALDEIDFKKISQGLNSVKRAIIGITNIDSGRLDTFSAILSDLSTKFLPFLQGVEAASGGLAAFNGILKQVGGRNVNAAVLQFEKLKNAERDTGEEAQQLNANISNATESIVHETKNTANQTAELALEQQKAALEANNHAIALLKAQYAMGQYGGTQRQYQQELKKLEEEQRRLRGETEKTTKGWKKFLNQIKRIAIYRVIRAALKAITSAFTDTIEAFSKVDVGMNDIMASVQNSLNAIKLSFGTILFPLIQMIEPILNSVAQAFANLGNTINASLSENGKFTYINLNNMKKYGKEVEKTNKSLLDFDKFRTLPSQQESSEEDQLKDMLDPNKSVEEFNKELGSASLKYKGIAELIKGISKLLSSVFATVMQILDAASPFISIIGGIVGGILEIVAGLFDILNESGLIKPIVGAILGYLIYIGATKVITWLQSGKLNSMLESLWKKISTVDGGLKGLLATNTALAIGIGALAGSLFYFLSSLDKMGTTAKILIPIIAALAAVITGVAVARAAAAAGVAAPIKAGITAAALAAAITFAAGTAIAVGKYEQGGLPDKGTMFIAGEAGAEMVYNMPSGQSGVANISQIQQAFYNALVQYGRENRGSDGAINVNIDGQKVFEVTRRTANKRGLDFMKV